MVALLHIPVVNQPKFNIYQQTEEYTCKHIIRGLQAYVNILGFLNVQMVKGYTITVLKYGYN